MGLVGETGHHQPEELLEGIMFAFDEDGMDLIPVFLCNDSEESALDLLGNRLLTCSVS